MALRFASHDVNAEHGGDMSDHQWCPKTKNTNSYQLLCQSHSHAYGHCSIKLWPPSIINYTRWLWRIRCIANRPHRGITAFPSVLYLCLVHGPKSLRSQVKIGERPLRFQTALASISMSSAESSRWSCRKNEQKQDLVWNTRRPGLTKLERSSLPPCKEEHSFAPHLSCKN